MKTLVMGDRLGGVLFDIQQYHAPHPKNFRETRDTLIACISDLVSLIERIDEEKEANPSISPKDVEHSDHEIFRQGMKAGLELAAKVPWTEWSAELTLAALNADWRLVDKVRFELRDILDGKEVTANAGISSDLKTWDAWVGKSAAMHYHVRTDDTPELETICGEEIFRSGLPHLHLSAKIVDWLQGVCNLADDNPGVCRNCLSIMRQLVDIRSPSIEIEQTLDTLRKAHYSGKYRESSKGLGRPIEIVSAPGDRCGGTRVLRDDLGFNIGPCPGCRACS